MSIPVIDFTGVDADAAHALRVAQQVDQALRELGFMLVTGIGIEAELLEDVFHRSRAFFTGPEDTKERCRYRSAAENFGYQGLGQENLDPDAPADLKETFTMRNLRHRPMPAERWPDSAFADVMQKFYAQALHAGYRLQRMLSLSLGLDKEYFVRCHSGENVSLRLLFYPQGGVEQVQQNQLGAGAHTDYGMLTLLFQDQVGGLQVRDAQGHWLDVEPIPGAVVINSGDLLERWTNGAYHSTLHRVQPRIGVASRLSVAMFIDPDSATLVEPLAACVPKAQTPRYAPITAGEHVQQKLDASHKDRFV